MWFDPPLEILDLKQLRQFVFILVEWRGNRCIECIWGRLSYGQVQPHDPAAIWYVKWKAYWKLVWSNIEICVDNIQVVLPMTSQQPQCPHWTRPSINEEYRCTCSRPHTSSTTKTCMCDKYSNCTDCQQHDTAIRNATLDELETWCRKESDDADEQGDYVVQSIFCNVIAKIESLRSTKETSPWPSAARTSTNALNSWRRINGLKIPGAPRGEVKERLLKPAGGWRKYDQTIRTGTAINPVDMVWLSRYINIGVCQTRTSL